MRSGPLIKALLLISSFFFLCVHLVPLFLVMMKVKKSNVSKCPDAKSRLERGAGLVKCVVASSAVLGCFFLFCMVVAVCYALSGL